MTKRHLNGKLKWVIATCIAGLVGTGFMVGGKILYFATIPATVMANVEKDEKEHAIFDEADRKSENIFVGIQKDIAQTKDDVARIAKTQENIDTKLDDLIIMQFVGPGSDTNVKK